MAVLNPDILITVVYQETSEADAETESDLPASATLHSDLLTNINTQCSAVECGKSADWFDFLKKDMDDGGRA